MVTTIQVAEETKDTLESVKLFPEETYEEVIRRLIEISKEEEKLRAERYGGV